MKKAFEFERYPGAELRVSLQFMPIYDLLMSIMIGNIKGRRFKTAPCGDSFTEGKAGWGREPRELWEVQVGHAGALAFSPSPPPHSSSL